MTIDRVLWPVAVCVPIRNEATLLPRFLKALSAQRGGGGFVLCAVLDGCTDDSAVILRSYAAHAPFAIVTASVASIDANAGRARRRAMDLGLDHVVGNQAVILSTDADSEPAPDWLSANVLALDQADVVAGKIVRGGDETSPTQDRVERYYDALFQVRRAIDPVPWEAATTHHYTSGASLGFRVGAYRDLGGFEPLRSAEDARIVDAGHRAGLRIRRDAAVLVQTSSRRTGRASNGLADHLRRLDEVGDADGVQMAHPEDECWRYGGHAVARDAWGDMDRRVGTLAARFGSPESHVRSIAEDAPNGEAFANRVVPDVPGGPRLIALDEAERALARIVDRRQVAA